MKSLASFIQRAPTPLTAGRRTLLAAVLALTGAAAWAGSPAYNFLNIPASTTSYGLGGLNISTVNDDVLNIDVNPALLGPEMDKAIGINYMHYVAGSNFAGARFATGAGDHSAWSLGLQYFGYGSMKETDETGAILGDFSPKDLAVSGSYARDINDRWRGGATVKFLYSSYASYTALALATDLGVNYFDADRDFSASLVVANLGGQVKRFTDSYDRLPFDVRLGATKGFGAMQVSVTAWNLTKWKMPYYDPGDGTDNSQPELKQNFASNLFRHLIFAVNYVPSERFHLGLGYNYKVRSDMATYHRSFLSGFSATMGIDIKHIGVSIAFAQPHSGASTIMLNITTMLSDFVR